jgi:hypothetical protein
VGNGGSIHHNNFFYNNLNGRSQAYGGSSYARWYDPPKLEGNYWSDWNGEVKYDVAGSTTDDLFPLSKPVEQIPASFPIPWNIEEPTDTSFLFLYSVLLIFCLAYLSLTCNKKGKKEK